MTNSPTVTTTSRPKPNQPRTIAEAPTPVFTLPFPMSWAMVLAATEAVCCHRTETRTKTADTKTSARAACETGRDGIGLFSTIEPSASTSSCQPGKVPSRIKQKNWRMMAMIL
jgi:hypothetical protein